MFPAKAPLKNSPTFFFFFFIIYFQTSPIHGDSPHQLQILLNLKDALRESNTSVFDSWKSENTVCNFTGIRCDSNFDVTEMDLSNRQLRGELPFDHICQLRSLRKLAFAFNSLYGRISQDLNKCIRLEYLDISSNLFTGDFPRLSSLNRLRSLIVNANGISGSFPWKSLTNASSSLKTLIVDDNRLDWGPFPIEITNFFNLIVLYFKNCSLEGPIPEGIGNLAALERLDLSINHLSGKIPSAFVKLTNLLSLELFSNSLTGKFPIGFRNLTSLQLFDASTNNLQGDLSELRFLTNLSSLQLYKNQFTRGVPKEFGVFPRLEYISLYMNRLSGPLPQNLGSSSKFILLDMSENFFTGSIPPDMCKHGAMVLLLLVQNRLTGVIPQNYANCLTLIRFRVNKNSLYGNVPAGIWGLPNSVIIDVRFNQLRGPISPQIANAKSLAHLLASNNQLSGYLPIEIGLASSLVAIDLSYNQFQGNIPKEIGNLKYLNTFLLQDNQFEGSIPESLWSCSYLNDVNMAANFLSGKIPSSIGSLSGLNSLNLSLNRLSGEIPSALSSLGLSLLDLSNNKFTGPVPRSLSIDAYNESFLNNSDLCSYTVTFLPRCSSKSGISKKIIALIACFCVLLPLAIYMLRAMIFNKRPGKSQHRSQEEIWTMTTFQILSFTTKDILDSLNQDNLIGKGGSGKVYMVTLANGMKLAVKRIKNTNRTEDQNNNHSSLWKRTGKSQEFEAEVLALSSLRHVNVVKLYCSISSAACYLLVYEYMPNGSLWDCLHSSKNEVFSWDTRYGVALGIAKGLEYLHHGCERPVIHRDIKSSNILLDDSLNPVIADFGLAKIVKSINGGKESTVFIAGTPGYYPPEYGYSCKVTEKCDVYCFGVVLMELVTGKRPLDSEFDEYNNIVGWVCKESSNTKMLSLVDPQIEGESEKEEAVNILRISIFCTKRLPEHRPAIRDVVKMLECPQMVVL